MIRRTTATPFAGLEEVEADANPMETVANLSDVMLVLAVALMLALITRMGVDFTAIQLNESDLEPVESSELTEGESTDSGGESEYQEVGKVYRNADGEMFILEG